MEPSPPTPGAPSPEWQRWKDTPGAAGRHIPSDDYLQRLSGAPDPFHPPPPQSQAPGATGQKGPIISGPLFSGGGPAQGGPGHYTMVREGLSSGPGVTAPGRPKTGSPAPAGAEPAPGPRKGSKLGTILGLIAVLLAIVAVVVVLILTG